MSLIVDHIQWIMIVSGVLTCTMVYAVVAPRAALSAMFGDTMRGPAAEIVVRNWGALITLVGAMLIYGAFDPPAQPFILVIAGASKLIFIGLVLLFGDRAVWRKSGGALAVDALVVALFAVFLLGR